MFDISIEINGRKVNPRNMTNVLEKAIITDLTESLKKSTRGIRCDSHGESPKLKVKGKNLDNLSVEVNGCCDTLIERVKRVLN